MLLVTCICSDPACSEEVEVLAASVEEAEREVCASCACVVQVLGVSEAELVAPRLVALVA